MNDCLFCRIAAGELPAVRVHEDERTVAILDIHPATRGHALVLPRAHSTDVHDIAADDLAAAAATAQLLAGRARTRLGADGVLIMQNSGAASWQTVFHYHVHVIPRYAGDPLVLPWARGGPPDSRDELGEISHLYQRD
ncbi:MAG TPA: HIT domain-containing protein [Gaiellales bacterium]|nr:HIT domain-containing protein [Gaiellales bacterium]